LNVYLKKGKKGPILVGFPEDPGDIPALNRIRLGQLKGTRNDAACANARAPVIGAVPAELPSLLEQLRRKPR
jgi:hypothetical protein